MTGQGRQLQSGHGTATEMRISSHSSAWKKTVNAGPTLYRYGLWKQVGNCSESSHFILKVNVDFAFNFIIFALFTLPPK